VGQFAAHIRNCRMLVIGTRLPRLEARRHHNKFSNLASLIAERVLSCGHGGFVDGRRDP
jgi:hypothetical protein